VQFRGLDNAGNAGAWGPTPTVAGATARIDRTAPTVTVNGGSLAYQSAASVSVTGSATDTHGGVSGYEYRTSTDGGSTWGTATPGATVSITALGETLVQLRATDAAGNVSAWTPASATAGSTVRIDRKSIVLRASTSAVNNDASTLVLTVPAGTVANDQLLAQVVVEGGSATTITPPAGWTLVRRTDNSGDIAQAVYRRTATGTETATYTWTFGSSLKAAGGMAGYSGVQTTSPVAASSGATGASSTSLTATGVTTIAPDSMVVGFYGQKSASTFTPAASMGEIWDLAYTAGGSPAVHATHEVVSAAGATGTRTSTSSGPEVWIGQLIALNPSDTTPPTAPTVSGGSLSWQSVASVTVSASGSTDAGSGLSGYEYRTSTDGGSTWSGATSGSTVGVTAEGETLVQFRAIDVLGNTSAWTPASATAGSTVRIDRTTPTAPTVSGGSLSWQSVASVTVTGSASTDAGGSALSGYQYRTSTDGGTTWGTATSGASAVISAEGETLVQLRSVDGAGNTSAWTPSSPTAGSTARIDRTAPTAPTVSGGSLSWLNQASTTVTASGSTDANAGLSGYEYRTSTDGGSTWGTATAGSSVVVSAAGETLVQFRATDTAGNAGAWTPASATAGSTVRLDRTSPTATSSAASGIGTGTATLNGTVNPGGGSTTNWWFEWGTSAGSLTNSTASTSAGTGSSGVAVNASISGLAFNSTYHFRVVAEDAAGNRTNGSTLSFTTANAFTWVDEWSSGGSASGQISSAEDVEIGPDGRAYVADSGNNRIQVFDVQGNFVRKWGTSGSGSGQLNSPRGIAFNASGDVFVADWGNGRVQVFSSTGTFIRTFGTGTLSAPNGIAIAANGEVFVVDETLNQVFVYNQTGTLQRSFGSYGTGPGQFTVAENVAVNATHVFVTDESFGRVSRFTLAGAFVNSWTTVAPIPGMSVPQDIEVDGSGDVYLTNYGSGRIHVYDTAGLARGQFGTPGSGTGQLTNPIGLAVAANGTVLVTDLGRNRVLRYTPTNLDTTPPTAPTVSGGSLSWQSVASVTVTGSGSTDTGGSGVTGYEYRTSTDGGTVWSAATSGASLAVTEQGETLVQFRAVDAEGNRSAWSPSSSGAGNTVRIDRTAPAANAGGELVTNGGFETPAVSGAYETRSTTFGGWTVDSGNVDHTATDFAPSSGTQSLDLNGANVPGAVSQTLATASGTTYRITFRMAGNPNYEQGVKEMTVG